MNKELKQELKFWENRGYIISIEEPYIRIYFGSETLISKTLIKYLGIVGCKFIAFVSQGNQPPYALFKFNEVENEN